MTSRRSGSCSASYIAYGLRQLRARHAPAAGDEDFSR